VRTAGKEFVEIGAFDVMEVVVVVIARIGSRYFVSFSVLGLWD
jgi:hypothetical protein